MRKRPLKTNIFRKYPVTTMRRDDLERLAADALSDLREIYRGLKATMDGIKAREAQRNQP